MHAPALENSFATDTVRPAIAYGASALVAGVLLTILSYQTTGGPFLMFSANPEAGILTMIGHSLHAAFVIAIAAALPTANGICLIKSFNLPRGVSDAVLGALVPVGLVALLAIADTIWFEGRSMAGLVMQVAVVGAIAGLVYWLAAGRPARK